MAIALHPRNDEKQALEMSAVEIQQEYYMAMGDVDWELYQKSERKHLLQKIAIALYGPPTLEGNLMSKDKELKLQGYEKREQEKAMEVFGKICKQAKFSHNGENILISILRVVWVAPTEDVPFYKLEPKDYWVNLHDKKKKEDVTICVFHVFSLRKCIALQPGEKGCRVFIDHDARVYQDWNSYLTENKLPKGVLVVPANGEYKGVLEKKTNHQDEGFVDIPKVILTIQPSPALGLGARVLSAADTASTAASLGALAAGIGVGVAGAMAVPVAAPVAFTVMGVGAATSLYGIVRSSIHLADRSKHEESIGLDDSEARASWINIIVSSVGLSFSTALKLTTWAARTGVNVKVLLNALQFLEYSTLASGFVGVVNGFGDMIYKYKNYDEKPTKLEIFQLTSSLLFFGIGVMSNQTAQEIVKDAQIKSVNEVRDSLTSNKQRKIFDKVTAETRRLEGTVKGNADVIKGLKNIDNKKDFFSKLAKMNKQANKNKLRISLSSDGKPLINNQHKVTVSDLHGLGKAGRDQLFAKYGPANVTSKNAPTRQYTSNAYGSGSRAVNDSTVCYVRPEELVKIATFLMRLSQMDIDSLNNILSELTADLHDAFLLLCAELFASFGPMHLNLKHSLGPHYNIRVINFILKFLRSRLGECDTDDESLLQRVLYREFICNGRIKPETLKLLTNKFLNWLSRENVKCNRHPSQYDDIHKFRKGCNYNNLQAGQEIEVGEHTILVKAVTIDKFEEILEDYSQEKCDKFIEYCFKVIERLTKQEVNMLNIINPDEDAIVRVAETVSEWDAYYSGLDDLTTGGRNSFDEAFVDSTKKKVVNKWSKHKIRNHVTCSVCLCMCYCDETV